MGLLAGRTLAADVAPGDRFIQVTPPLGLGANPSALPIQIGSELMEIAGGRRGKLLLSRPADSAHSAGAAIVERNLHVASAPGGGGAIAVDNTVDPPAEVTTLVVPGADVSTPGEANLGAVVTILSASVTLTDAQIKALPTTPLAVVGAGGAGTILVPVSAVLHFDWTADYTNVDGSAFLVLAYDSSFVPVLARLDETTVVGVSDFFGSGEDTVAFLPAFVETEAGGGNFGSWQASGDVVNQGIAVRIFNAAAGALTGGNAANTLKVTVWYGVMDLS